jgi:hypothetical protein
MSYTITHANGTTSPIVIADGQTDNSTSITLVGKNTPNYGSYLNQNFFNMLENFASNSSPASPLKGQLWYDTSQNLLKVYNGAAFRNVAAAASGPVGPLNPSTGDLWFDTNNVVLNCYTASNGWITIGPTSAGAVTQESITDSGQTPHFCLVFRISGSPFAILSFAQSFTPLNPAQYLGFSTINPGLNIALTSQVANNKFWGQASDSAALNGIPGTNFMRSDQNTGTSGFLAITSNVGLKVGSAGQGQVSVSSNEVRLDNAINNGILRFRTYNTGSPVDSMDVLGNADVQVNYNLILHGNLVMDNASGYLRLTGAYNSIDTDSGTLRIPYGGAGFGGNINVGGPTNNFTGNIYAYNVSTTANVFAGNVVSPVVGNATTKLGGWVTNASQPNITALGTLTGIQVTGIAGFTGGTVTFNPTTANKLVLGNVGNVQIAGGSTGQYLITDGSGNMNWISLPININQSSVAGQIPVYNNASYISGNAGITYNSANLTVTGNLTATGDIVAYYSDSRLKTNVTPITSALEKVNMINGVTYNTNDIAEKLGLGDNREHVGVIAQEIQSVLPQVVRLAPFDSDSDGHSKSGENYLTVQYEKIIPLLIQAIKELHAEVEELKKR